MGLGLAGAAATTRADTPVYADWPQEPEWVTLTNHLQWCYDALVERYEAAGKSSVLVHEPGFVVPYADYVELARDIDSIATNYVNHTLADAQGSFESFFEQTGTNDFPRFTVSNLHVTAGFKDWTTNYLLHSWCTITNRAIQAQVASAIENLRWTSRVGYYTNIVVESVLKV